MRIGILLTGDYSWAGGLYYSLNIIKLLQQISITTSLKVIVIINNTTAKELIEQLNLENVQFANLDNKPFLYKLFCKIMGVVTKSNYRFVKDINALKLNTIYPLINYDKAHKKLNCKAYYWLYDFQHKFLPELFSKEEIIKRDINFKNITTYTKNIVVSSNDSKNHLLQFYPNTLALIDVYSFVSLIENVKHTFTLKTTIPQNYFIVCNQFWPHKNHLVVLQAVHYLKTQNQTIHIVFTGKHNDVRNEKYVTELKNYINKNNINSLITFTGFISREDQIELIKNSKAVIQPSLFEGWSTVIEDAKALNKYIIASDIEINKEQIQQDVSFFAVDDYIQLSKHLVNCILEDKVFIERNYLESITESRIKLSNILKI